MALFPFCYLTVKWLQAGVLMQTDDCFRCKSMQTDALPLQNYAGGFFAMRMLLGLSLRRRECRV